MTIGKPPNHESFLDLYLRYTEKQESPEMFHLWVGFTILSAAMGRKCYMRRGYYTLYPNLFTILVAGSARCRKSTAISIGVRLLKDIPSTKIIKGKISPEQFIQELETSQVLDAKDEAKEKVQLVSPNILVHSSELSVFLTKQSYGEPLIHILTDLFDCPDDWTYKTKNKGTNSLKDVFITILAATTPTGVAQGIPVSALHEGFASRVLFCFQADTDRRNAFPVLSPEEVHMSSQLKEILENRAQLEGEFLLTQEAHDWFKTWYDKHMSEDPEDVMLDGMHGRKHDHLLRIGMLFAGSYGVKLVQQHHLEAALMSIESLERVASGAFREIGGDEHTPHMARLRSYMKKLRTCPHSILLQKMYPINAQVLAVLVDTAVQSGWMKRATDKSYIYEYCGT